jgi:predicted Zn-dependent protease
MNVHVWPTTVIVRSDGREAGHLAGLPTSYAADLQAYVEFAQDKIDQAALEARLNNHSVVEDSNTQAAKRRLNVATRFIETGDIDAAAGEVDAGLKLSPQEPGLLMAKTDVLIARGEAAAALELLDKMTPGTIPQWHLELHKGKAYVALGRWDDAKRVLPDAIKLNPNPAEAHYLLGISHQSSKEFEKAAEEFRAACESTSGGTKLAPPRAASK